MLAVTILPLGRNNVAMLITDLSWIAFDSGPFKKNQYSINWINFLGLACVILVIGVFPLVSPVIQNQSDSNISNADNAIGNKTEAFSFFYSSFRHSQNLIIWKKNNSISTYIWFKKIQVWD